MKTFIEFHLIQNFAPSNLNRDDTGSPKDAMFGGFRRARVSSQCLKRAIRLEASDKELISKENRSIRTKRLQEILLDRLPEPKRVFEDAPSRLEVALAAAGLKLKQGQTEYLLFLAEREVAGFAQLIEDKWENLDITSLKASEGGDKKGKKKVKSALDSDLVKAAKQLLDGGKAVDVALFGRMLADLPEVNREASCQVAHAISTHRVDREFDYYTAVDDHSGPSETGAGMIGQVEFNAPTFYRYAVLDVQKLYQNLQQDTDLTLAAVEAFTEAIARAVPTGKQNSFAAHNPPEFIGVSVRHASPLNLANAFERPVVARSEQSLTAQSVMRLHDYEKKLTAVYGSEKDRWLYLDLTDQWGDRGEQQLTLKAMSQNVRKLAATILGGGSV